MKVAFWQIKFFLTVFIHSFDLSTGILQQELARSLSKHKGPNPFPLENRKSEANLSTD